MVALTLLRGLVRHRPARVAGTALGVAIAVALMASIGAFLSATNARMTTRAVARVPVDWQVQAGPGADPARLQAQLRRFPGVTRAVPMRFARTTGLAARTGSTVQRTGPGRVLGVGPDYATAFPGTIRVLAGRPRGVLLAQQTAANLHAQPGSVVRIGGARGTARVRVDGIVDLPSADSLFQQVGAPPGAQPQAPPDNVILLPLAVFNRLEGTGVTQIHVRLDRRLPGSPSVAFSEVSSRARNLEARLAGTGLVGDNLGTALDQARQDALYAQLLFLFLGVPGAIVAGLVTAAVGAAGGERRRHDAALLRTRGASTRSLLGVAVAEAVLAAGAGIALGLAAALVIGSTQFGTATFGAGTASAVLWAAGAALAGILVAAGAIALPAWRDALGLTVAGQRRVVGRSDRAPRWARGGVDVLCLLAAALVYRQAAANGYSLVLAPEGVPQVSVNWYALLAPVLTWVGTGLLALRLARLVLTRARRQVQSAIRPLAGELSAVVAATMARRHAALARATALLALTAAFAASTAVFNATYAQQAEVDARLTNGADVTVTESPGARVGPQAGRQLANVAGVRSVEPMQHRFAYVGADLQDLYGVRPASIGRGGRLQDAWFQGGTATGLMGTLAHRPDAILVAAETVRDFQLRPGDPLHLRLQDGRTKRLVTVTFHYVGVAREFPTAPTDSFLVANADYVARATGSPAIGTFLLQTGGRSPAQVAAGVRNVVGASTQVTDIETSRRVVGSNLTAVELSGLTRVELALALVLCAAASGLTLALGLRERRQMFAVIAALGARRRQLDALVWSESAFVTAGGLLAGGAIAVVLTHMLVKILTGVFDPPPDRLAVPWPYLLAGLAVVLAAVGTAAQLALASLRRPRIEDLRDT